MLCRTLWQNGSEQEVVETIWHPDSSHCRTGFAHCLFEVLLWTEKRFWSLQGLCFIMIIEYKLWAILGLQRKYLLHIGWFGAYLFIFKEIEQEWNCAMYLRGDKQAFFDNTNKFRSSHRSSTKCKIWFKKDYCASPFYSYLLTLPGFLLHSLAGRLSRRIDLVWLTF